MPMRERSSTPHILGGSVARQRRHPTLVCKVMALNALASESESDAVNSTELAEGLRETRAASSARGEDAGIVQSGFPVVVEPLALRMMSQGGPIIGLEALHGEDEGESPSKSESESESERLASETDKQRRSESPLRLPGTFCARGSAAAGRGTLQVRLRSGEGVSEDAISRRNNNPSLSSPSCPGKSAAQSAASSIPEGRLIIR